jgi:hypothetical protein
MEHAFLIGTGILLALALVSTTFANVVMLIPGHIILTLLCRIAKVENRKDFDRRGNASMAIGFLFWVVVLGSAYAWERISR